MTDYSLTLIPAARILAARGALDRDLRHRLRRPLSDHPRLEAAASRLRRHLPPDAADEAVERALFRKATGYNRRPSASSSRTARSSAPPSPSIKFDLIEPCTLKRRNHCTHASMGRLLRIYGDMCRLIFLRALSADCQ